MGDSKPADASPRSGGVLPVQKPRWAFWKGLLTGAAIEIPLLALAVFTLARLGIGNPDVGLMRIVRITTVFAGVAALLTAGGIGRVAAYALVDLGGHRRRAIGRAARAHAAASAGLVVIAAIPHGGLPATPWHWLAFAAAGLVCGAVAGALIGLVCTSQTSLVQLADVWSLARKPRVALRTLLDPEDLVRLGSALRARTTNLFEGIFEPAPPPPKAEPAPGERPAVRDAAAREPAAAEAPAAEAPASPRNAPRNDPRIDA
ncbi:MAG TPA: hypothetical protein VK932_03090 [Kofleriaceae bacterium]|nr:hypothetical protein [Kofleriaceae bacterium]